MDRLIPFVIHGLVACFSWHLETTLIGACLFNVLFSLLKKVEHVLSGLCDEFPIINSQSMPENFE